MPEDVNTQFEDLLEKVEKYLSHLTNRYKVLLEQVDGYKDKYHPEIVADFVLIIQLKKS